MIPVRQEHLFSDHGWGDCMSACIASILEIDLGRVPQFTRLINDGYYDRDECPYLGFQDHMGKWLNTEGFGALHFRKNGRGLWRPFMPGMEGQFVIVGGPSERCADGHSVVGKVSDMFGGVDLIHDPHPDGTFLSGQPDELIFLVRINYAMDQQSLSSEVES